LAPDSDPSKPLLFVAMPFGTKTEPAGMGRVDFDSLYESCIKGAAHAVGVEVIRADEETLGGVIHRPMYERLLLAEIVVADLTFANPNVFYELGVRHAARPRSTILICGNVAQLPFDVSLIRAIPYELDEDGVLTDPAELRRTLTDHLETALTDEVTDSPLFQLLDDYPGVDLPHESTEAFRERALWVSDLTVRANEAVKPGGDRASARQALVEIQAEATAGAAVEEQLLVTLMLAYRSIEDWDQMIQAAESLPGGYTAMPIFREQLAMALSRRNDGDDRSRAVEILLEVIDEHGESAETLGILGRCFKARWLEKAENGDAGAADVLDEAIEVYRRGFESDPRDFYPGINLITLLFSRGTGDDLEEIEKLTPVLSFALARQGGLKSRDYWVLATLLELSVINGEAEFGSRALSAMLDTEPEGWMIHTTVNNLDIVARALERLGRSFAWASTAAQRLRAAT
jgi:MAP3K TRAFs-binding domain